MSIPISHHKFIGIRDYSDLTGTTMQVVEVFFSTHGEGFSFELSRDRISIWAVFDGVPVGHAMLPVPPNSRMFQEWETRRENWWFLLGFVIGLKQISGRMRMQSDAGAEALARLPWVIPANNPEEPSRSARSQRSRASA